MKNINNNYNMLNEVYNMDMNNNKLNSKLNIIELTQKNDFLNNNNLTRSHSSKILLNNISLNDGEIKTQHNSLKNEFLQNHSDSKKLNIENKPKNNNIIINNNIITYNSNNNINKIHNYFAKEKLQNGQFNPEINNNTNRISLNQKPINTQRAPYIDKTEDFNIIYKKKNDPTDGKSLTKNNLSYDFGKKLKFNFDNIPKISKHHNDSKNICEFCKNYCDDLVLHYKYYHLKGNKGSIKPIKRDTALLNEKLNSTNIDEVGIDENKRKILFREFRATFHGVKNNNKIFNLKSNLTKNNKKFEKIKIVKKNIPDDNKKIEEVIRASDSLIKFKNKMKIPLLYNGENSRRQNSEGNIFNNTYNNIYSNNLNSSNPINTQQINFYNEMDMYNPILSYSDIRNSRQINSDGLLNYLNITN